MSALAHRQAAWVTCILAQAADAAAKESMNTPTASDEALTLACERALRPFGGGVRVHVSQGWVRLSGSVTLARDRWRAEERIGRIPGAVSVSAQITCREA